MSIQPDIIPRTEHTISRSRISPNAVRVLQRLKARGFMACLVGGGVRDLLLGREPKDFDIVTDARPQQIKKLFGNCRLIGRRFRLAHIHFGEEIIEVATFRAASDPEEEVEAPEAESVPETAPEAPPVTAGATAPPVIATPARPPRMLKSADGMILRDNVFGTPEEDALRRDFTVNALYYNIADFSVIDYAGGMADLRDGLIRLIGDPVVRFTEDPVRMVRAVRFAAMLGFRIEEDTYRAMLEMKDRIAFASPSRLYEEVLKLFLLGEGEQTFQMLRRTGLFGVLFPRIDEWLGAEEDGFPHVRIGKALDRVDDAVHEGRKMEPHLVFALMFGQFIEEKAAELREQGMVPLAALDQAVAGFLSDTVPRVQIPRRAALGIRDILWFQGRFERRQGKYPYRLVHRPFFREAFDYLKFLHELTGERADLVEWWTEFIAKNPPAPADGGTSTRPLRSRRRRRRRRKEGTRGTPVTPGPSDTDAAEGI